MKNIFIEGIQGSGKSTLFQTIAEKNPNLNICREGDYSPIELAWCTWTIEKEYNQILEKYSAIKNEILNNTVKESDSENNIHYIIKYTRIITDILGFHKYLENYEIYNGRKNFLEFKNIVFSRYKRFSNSSFEQNNYLFECSFFQNIMENLMLYFEFSNDEIIEFYKELYHVIDKQNFVLLYLQSNDIESNINTIKKERSDNLGNELWYPLMLEYLINSPYGKKHGYKDFHDMISHFSRRQELELKIINDIIKDNAVILPSKALDYDKISKSIH